MLVRLSFFSKLKYFNVDMNECVYASMKLFRTILQFAKRIGNVNHNSESRLTPPSL